MVNWEAIGAVGEIVGAVAVFLTLLYLAVQIRQNTKAVKAAALDSAATHITAARHSIYSDESLTDIYVRGGKDPTSLTENELVRYRLLLHAMLQALSTVYGQTELSGLSRSSWESQKTIVYRVVSSNGGVWFWENYQHEFEDRFRSEVNALIERSAA